MIICVAYIASLISIDTALNEGHESGIQGRVHLYFHTKADKCLTNWLRHQSYSQYKAESFQ